MIWEKNTGHTVQSIINSGVRDEIKCLEPLPVAEPRKKTSARSFVFVLFWWELKRLFRYSGLNEAILDFINTTILNVVPYVEIGSIFRIGLEVIINLPDTET